MKMNLDNREWVSTATLRWWFVVLLILLLTGVTTQSVMAQARTRNIPPFSKLCPGMGGRLLYAGRGVSVLASQTCPEGRVFTLYLVADGQPVSSGIVVGAGKEVVTCRTVYSPGDKNYTAPTQVPIPQGRFDFAIPANLPDYLLNKPVKLHFGDPRPTTVYTDISVTYTINPASCP